MTNEEKQKMADAISTQMRSIAEEHDENLHFEYDVLKLALAALTAQPVKLPPRRSMLTRDDIDQDYVSCMAISVEDAVAAIRKAGYEVQE